MKCIERLASGEWDFKGVTKHIYSMDEFDKANEDMENHRDGYIKGAVRCN